MKLQQFTSPDVEARYAALVRSSGDAIIDKALDGTILSWNPAAVRLFGYEAAEAIGRNVRMLEPPDLRGEIDGILERIARGDGAVSLETRRLRTDGQALDVEVSVSPVMDTSGAVRGASTIARDIVVRKRREVRALREARNHEAQFRAITEHASEGIFCVDGDGRATYSNPAGLRLFGFGSIDEILGRHFSEFLSLDSIDDVQGLWVTTIGAGRPADPAPFTARGIRADGRRIDVEVSVGSWDVDGRTNIVGMFRDVTNRLESERELRTAHAELRQLDADRQLLIARLIKAQEEERKLISEGVHDDSIQVMSAAALRLRTLERSMLGGSDAAMVTATAAAVEQAIVRLRHLMFELRPPALDREGLVAAIRTYLASASMPFRCDLIDELTHEPGELIGGAIYRIVQEALSNVCRHARAQLVTITVRDHHGGVQVSIRDDGIGFDVDQVLSRQDASKHLGLVSMRERAELVGGWWVASSELGKGTLIEFWVPGRVRLVEAG